MLLTALALAGCEQEAEPPVPVRPVLTTVVAPVTSETFGPFAGTVEPRYSARLGFQIAGRVVARDAEVGDLVKAGQRLAALDAKVPSFALNQAKADVADAEAQNANAAATAARQKTLFDGGSVTKAQLETTTAAADTAAARLVQARANLQRAQDQFGYTELRADTAGVVTAWTAEVSQVVSAGQAVVTVARPDVIEAVVDIPDGLIAAVSPGEAFAVALQSAPAVTARGIVREIAPQSDSATRTRRVRLTLESPPSAFRLGTTVAVALRRPIPPRIALPATAIRSQDGRDAVWLVADGRVLSRDVTVTARAAEAVTVGAGLASGDRVVTAGVHSLAEGQAVRLGRPL
ncbi:efflux RND transporter periplasmic adaptor subunit [Lichenibacterium dinghuense]|uniref:efflux RND transporter periplasmic adaptor subunit n=1 Tax=Lichenibacterium dinghuense TaxID=2895977 RepID=UPI001F02D829|nr:efflux RND transporter periplasmic adaptor subunit [Lichenibacterium sp. 6Y81]